MIRVAGGWPAADVLNLNQREAKFSRKNHGIGFGHALLLYSVQYSYPTVLHG